MYSVEKITGAVSVQWGVLLPTVWGISTLLLIDLTENITEKSELSIEARRKSSCWGDTVQWGVLLPTVWGIGTLVLIDLEKTCPKSLYKR